MQAKQRHVEEERSNATPAIATNFWNYEDFGIATTRLAHTYPCELDEPLSHNQERKQVRAEYRILNLNSNSNSRAESLKMTMFSKTEKNFQNLKTFEEELPPAEPPPPEPPPVSIERTVKTLCIAMTCLACNYQLSEF